MKIKEIIGALERFAPLPLQDSFDNAGLQTGLTEAEATGALLCLDVTEAVVDEAVALGLNLVVSHHPLLFHPLRSLCGRTETERCLMKAVCHGIALYAAHTNLDNAPGGVNHEMARRIGLHQTRILSPRADAPEAGSGLVGVLPEPEAAADFLGRLKQTFGVHCLMHNRWKGRTVRAVALCGGAGSFLIPQALRAGADAFVTGEIKYHDFQGHDDDILLISMGHYESEQYTVDLLERILGDAFPQLPLRKTQVNTNPIQYT